MGPWLVTHPLSHTCFIKALYSSKGGRKALVTKMGSGHLADRLAVVPTSTCVALDIGFWLVVKLRTIAGSAGRWD